MKDIAKYCVDGISINRTKDGYSVHTVPTQHFYITDLSELTPERFEEEIKKQEELRLFEEQLFRESFKDLYQ